MIVSLAFLIGQICEENELVSFSCNFSIGKGNGTYLKGTKRCTRVVPTCGKLDVG